MYYIYVLEDSEVRWVGITNNPERRLAEHRYGGSNGPSELYEWMRNCIDPQLRVICVVESKSEACQIELELTQRWRAKGVPLFNVLAGRSYPEHLKERISSSCKAAWTDEMRETASKQKQEHWRRGSYDALKRYSNRRWIDKLIGKV